MSGKPTDQHDDVQPVGLSLEGPDTLVIQWSDGTRRLYHPVELRQNCPCASCLNQSPSGEAEVGTGADGQVVPLTIRQMAPVGNYAYKVVFSDGHSTGIFPLPLLRSLGREG